MKRAVRAALLLALVFLGAATALHHRQVGKFRETRVDSAFAGLDSLHSPGVAVLVVQNGEVVLRKGYGMAGLEHQRPITPTTVFDIASVSKQFAGMAIAMLVEEGAVSLDDDIRQYLPELHDFGHTITIDHLVHHTSGLRDWPGTLAVAGWSMEDVISFNDILRMAFHQEDLNFIPGTEYTYSNTGYNLLAAIVERLTGQRFRFWVHDRIFEPLGMENTHFHDRHTEVVPDRAYSYARSADSIFTAIPNQLTAVGSSSLYTTIDDLAKWILNFEDRAVGGDAVVDRMLTRGCLEDGTTIPYAFGVNVGERRGRTTVSHGGSWASFRTFLLHFPEERLGVVVLSNHTPFNASAAAYRVADIYLNPDPSAGSDPDEPAPEETEARLPDPDSPPPSIDSIEVHLDEFPGMYRLGPGWYVRITRGEDRLFAQATSESRVPMEARSETRFWVEDYGDAIEFRRDETGRVTGFTYRGIEAPRLEDRPAPTPGELQDLLGVYYSSELDTSYEIALEEETLVARHQRNGTIRLAHAWGDDFRSSEWFIRSLEFLRGEDGEVEGLLINGGERVRNLFFRRSRW